MEHRIARRSLIVLDSLAALSAMGGAAIVVTGWPYQFPIEYLKPTPFSDYTIPGMILGFVVGGSALVAAWETFRSPSVGALASFAAGLIMMAWIVGEYLLVPAIRMKLDDPTSWLQPIYLVIGFGMVALAVRVASPIRLQSVRRHPNWSAPGFDDEDRHRNDHRAVG